MKKIDPHEVTSSLANAIQDLRDLESKLKKHTKKCSYVSNLRVELELAQGKLFALFGEK